MEGMRGFVARHAAALDRATARASSCSSASAAPRRSCSRARACCGCATTRRAMRDWLADCAERAGARAAPRPALRLRHRRADRAQGRLPDRASWPRSTSYKMAPNYHSQRDVAANLDLGTVAAAAGGLPRGGPLAQPPASSRARLIASSRVAIAPA